MRLRKAQNFSGFGKKMLRSPSDEPSNENKAVRTVLTKLYLQLRWGRRQQQIGDVTERRSTTNVLFKGLFLSKMMVLIQAPTCSFS